MTHTTPSAEPSTAHTLRPASVWLRVAGLVYDLVAAVAIVMVVGGICEAATGGNLVGSGRQIHTPWWYPTLQYLIVVGYFVVSWRRGGQTLGMRPWRMYLRSMAGTPISWKHTLVRALVASLPLLLLAGADVFSVKGALWAVLIAWIVFFGTGLFNPRHRALHDLVAGTEILQRVMPKRPRRVRKTP